MPQSEILKHLTAAAESGDGDRIEDAMADVFEGGFDREFVSVFVIILAQRSHRMHEDIVRLLQELKDPRAVDALYAAAVVDHEHLAYDEFFGLARKCTWALADIGTPEAHSRLQMLADHSNPQIAAYAKKRLDRWDDERHRKGA